MKETSEKATALIESFEAIRKPFGDFDLDSLCIVDTSTLTDTLKAAVPEFNFSEVCYRLPPW